MELFPSAVAPIVVLRVARGDVALEGAAPARTCSTWCETRCGAVGVDTLLGSTSRGAAFKTLHFSLIGKAVPEILPPGTGITPSAILTGFLPFLSVGCSGTNPTEFPACTNTAVTGRHGIPR